jgi:membrane protein DedA with SNARE-associated domain
MTIMQGQNLNFWFWIEVALIVLAVLGTWYMTIAGRDQKPRRQRRGEETIEHYGAGLAENRAPLPKFMVLTIVGVVVWAVGYLIWTGIYGLGY